MRCRADTIEAGLAAVMAAFTAQPADIRLALAEMALAAVICGHDDHRRASVSLRAADSAALHVMALIRRHYSGERRLPVAGEGDAAGTGFCPPDAMPLHLPRGVHLR